MKLVFTGPGKGKTSAAAGIAFRSWGQGRRVKVILFLKDRAISGEWKTSSYLKSPRLDVESYGRTCPYPNRQCCPGQQECIVTRNNWKETDEKQAREGLVRAHNFIFSGEWDLVILDEILYLWSIWPDCQAMIMNFLQNAPEQTDLILTGRYYSKEIVELVDTVTFMDIIKHPFQKGIKAKEGIDY